MKKYLWIFAVLSFVLFQSCGDSQTLDDFTLETGKEYFPLTIGKSIIYRVDSVYHQLVGLPDTVRLLVREKIIDTIPDLNGEMRYVTERSERSSANEPWEFRFVFTQKLENTRALRTEDNQTFISLTFPPSERKDWKGTAFNSDSLEITVRGETIEVFKDWNSRYEDIHIADVVNGLAFDSVLVVFHANSTNFIEQRINLEKYAKGVGLVYKEMAILESQKSTERVWPRDAEKGFELRQWVVEYE